MREKTVAAQAKPETEALESGYFGKEVPSVGDADSARRTLQYYRLPLLRMIEALPQHARVLDAGSGSGKIVRLICAVRPDVEVVAIDISDTKRYLPKNVAFHRLSVETLSEHLEHGSFDAIVCLHVLEHLLYPMRTLEVFRTLLKSDGLLYIELPNWTRALMFFSDKFFYADYSHVRLFSKKTLLLLARDYRFEIRCMRSCFAEKSLRGRLAAGLMPDILYAVFQKRD